MEVDEQHFESKEFKNEKSEKQRKVGFQEPVTVASRASA